MPDVPFVPRDLHLQPEHWADCVSEALSHAAAELTADVHVSDAERRKQFRRAVTAIGWAQMFNEAAKLAAALKSRGAPDE